MPTPSYIPKIVYNGITLTFTYPLDGQTDNGEQSSADVVTSTALAGDLQVVYNHTEITRYLKFRLLTPTQLASLQTFFDNWAKLGNSFSFYESDNLGTFQTYTLDPGSTPWVFNPVREVYSGNVGGFLASVEMTFRRAV